MISDRNAEIAKRAYEIWENERRPNDRATAHWLQAKAELGPEPETSVNSTDPKPSKQPQARRKGTKMAKWPGILAAVAVIIFVGEQAFVFWEYIFFYEKTGGDKGGFWQLTSSIANCGLLLVAGIALAVAWYQFNEATKSRRANLYVNIESRWFSAPVKESKIEISNIVTEFIKTIPGDTPRAKMDYYKSAEGTEALQNLVTRKLLKLRTENIDKYLSIMVLPDLFEYIGLLVAKKYLPPNDVKELMKTSVIDTRRIFNGYISAMQRAAPSAYEHWVSLADLFISPES